MDFIWESITDWLKEILISGIVSNLSGMFDSTNEQVGNIIGQVGMTPQSWNSGIFTMIQNLSNTVILPIAGAILAIVMTLELIQLITDRNNLNDVDTWMFFKWVFKSACAVVIVTHTWDIVMGIFEASQSVVSSAAGVIVGQTNIDISSVVGGLESRLNEMELGPLFGLWFQSLFVGLCTWAITICIFIITYGRMIEVFLVTSVAPIPMATMVNREWGQMGQNYLRTLFSLGFQAFLIVVCVAIYSVLVQNISVSGDISAAIWTCMGYTVLLCFCLFKTSSLPYLLMRQDGICQVTRNHYTKTIQFQDINYQLSDNEDKQAIFDSWCDFLNYFDSSVSFQLSFINLTGLRGAALRTIPVRTDQFESIQRELSGVIQNQQEKGNNGIVKTKYLTFGIDADSVRSAKPRLERIETDILNNFKRLGVSAQVLTGKERLRVCHDILRMDTPEPFLFRWEDLPRSGLSTKDYIAPSSFSLG